MQDRQIWDAVVIGSGMGGLSCAAALAKTGHRVAVVEQHSVAGGLTQTFRRGGFRWDVGVHYLGEVGPQGESHELLDWLTDDAIEFASLGTVYDILHFPDGFEVKFPCSETAIKDELKAKFPESASDIDVVFLAMAEADRAGRALFPERAMPGLLAKVYGLWHDAAIRKWWGRSSAEVLGELVHDPKLRAVLLAQKDNYGGVPAREMSFGLQAMVMRHYFNGAYYPVGGAGAFADALVPVIEQAGGAIKLKAKVKELLVENSLVVGVLLDDGSTLRAHSVFSGIGARNTVGLLPAGMRDSEWSREILSFAPSVCHVGLYLGLEGDIRANGATASNHWFHENWDINGDAWDPASGSPAPAVFISFPSLKDPEHDPGAKRRHTAEIVAMVRWDAFAPWQDSALGHRPPDYIAFKADIERRLMEQFARYFPALAPLVVTREMSTPLTNAAFIGSQHGAIYGIEVSPRRFLSKSLRARTPVPGLYLTGQDVVTPGVTGAMIAGVLSASRYESKVRAHLL
jgi:all-trans-retinol 13,14-reductase